MLSSYIPESRLKRLVSEDEVISACGGHYNPVYLHVYDPLWIQIGMFVMNIGVTFCSLTKKIESLPLSDLPDGCTMRGLWVETFIYGARQFPLYDSIAKLGIMCKKSESFRIQLRFTCMFIPSPEYSAKEIEHMKMRHHITSGLGQGIPDRLREAETTEEVDAIWKELTDIARVLEMQGRAQPGSLNPSPRIEYSERDKRERELHIMAVDYDNWQRENPGRDLSEYQRYREFMPCNPHWKELVWYARHNADQHDEQRDVRSRIYQPVPPLKEGATPPGERTGIQAEAMTVNGRRVWPMVPVNFAQVTRISPSSVMQYQMSRSEGDVTPIPEVRSPILSSGTISPDRLLEKYSWYDSMPANLVEYHCQPRHQLLLEISSNKMPDCFRRRTQLCCYILRHVHRL